MGDSYKTINEKLQELSRKKSDTNAVDIFLDFLTNSNIEGIDTIAAGIKAILGLASNSNQQQITDEQIEKVKSIRVLDAYLMAAAANRKLTKTDIENIIDDNTYNRGCLYKKIIDNDNNDERNKYNSLVAIVKERDEFKNFYSTTDIDCNQDNQTKYDFSNIPKSDKIYLIRTSVIESIVDKFQNSNIVQIHADGGYGKSSISKQYVNMHAYDFEDGYAWSSYNQGSPKSDEYYKDFNSAIASIINHFGIKDILNDNDLKRQIFRDKYNTEQSTGKIRYEGHYLTEENHDSLLKAIFASDDKKDIYTRIIEYYFKKKSFLIVLDGMENFTLDSNYIDFLDTISKLKSLNSKLLITTREPIEGFNNIKIEKLSNEEIVEFIKNYQNIDETAAENIFDRFTSYKALISVPLVLLHTCRLLKNTELNGIEKNIIEVYFKNDSKQIDSIYKYFENLISKNINDELKNFMYVASLLHRPISDIEYDEIRKKLGNSFPERSAIENDLSESHLAVFDTNDAGKTDVDKGTYDIHPIIKEVFKSDIKNEDEDCYKYIMNVYGNYFKNKYNEAIKNPSKLDSQQKFYIFDAIFYYIKADKNSKALNLLLNKVNNNDPIKKFGLHYAALEACEKINSTTSKTDNYSFYKFYRFLATTFGKAKIARDISMDNIDKLDTMLGSISSTQEDAIFGEIGIDTIKTKEKIDWLIMSLEAVKYYGKLIKVDLLKIEKAFKNIPTTNENIISFWKFLYERRLSEVKYMYCNESIGDYIEKDNEENITLPQNFTKLSSEEYATYPHVLWRDRYISYMLNDIIEKYLNDQSGLASHINDENFIDLMKNYFEYEEIYIRTDRTAYLALLYLNKVKYNFLRLLVAKDNGEYKNDYSASAKCAISNALKSGKKDFIIEVYLSLVFYDYILYKEKDYYNTAKFYTITDKSADNINFKTEIYFLQKEFLLLDYLVDERISSDVYENIKENISKTQYLNNRLEAIQNFKKSQSQAS